ncbi:MAG: hypothetical protein K8953_06430, partial [Proteobacteria bacterium]|nr:hypothetical protein [Pseudomonadota bacterium]
STSLPGILSGLIGQEGAVGVFNAINSSHTYAGGFVVHEDVVIKADYDDWAQGQNFRDRVPASSPSNQFLETTGKVVPGSTVGRSNERFVSLNDDFEGVSLGGGADNGFVSFGDGNDPARDGGFAYAGIYQNTNLGAPLRGASDTFVRWLGRIQFNELPVIESNFRVGFDNTGAGGTIWAINANISDHADFLIDGDFDANGLITGKTHYARFVRDAAPARNAQSGTLRGIIGQQGAVGVFYGPSGFQNFNYSGGFVARPTLLVTGDEVVKYNDWLRRTITDASPDTTTFVRSQFLRASSQTLNSGGVSKYSSRHLDLNDVTPDGFTLGGSGNNGVTYFTTPNPTGYAGIYSNTNLGAPL